MSAEAAAPTKKKGPLKWYWVALITTGILLVVGYFMWPSSLSAKATYKYDPMTGKPYAAGSGAGFNTETGQALTA